MSLPRQRAQACHDVYPGTYRPFYDQIAKLVGLPSKEIADRADHCQHRGPDGLPSFY